MKSPLFPLAIILLFASSAFAAAEYPAPNPAPDTSSYGKHFQRTMTLTATSTPERRNTARILFYGQSITGQMWSDQVAAWLREKYPNTDFEIKNLALGGWSSQRLVRAMYYDVFPEYPDLLVFHVYGSHIDYESIIREVRRHTTAEIIVQSDHATAWPEPRAESVEKQIAWDGRMNHWFLPAIAKKFGVALEPQRVEWVQYLKDHNLEPKDLLSDSVHLNDHGKWLMAELLERYMVYLPNEPKDEWRDLVKTVEVGKDVRWEGDRLKIEFEGNRVTALAAQGPAGKARVLIDGKKPSDIPECYTHTRPSGTAGVGWPAIMKIGWEKPLVVEEWTATFREFNDKQDEFKFSVSGSLTGPDGEGNAKERFVSKSGRVVIEPGDWIFEYCKSVSKKPTPDGWQVRWKTVPMFVDEYTPLEVKDPAREYETVLAQGFENAKHTIELVAEGPDKPAIRAIRVYKPPVK